MMSHLRAAMALTGIAALGLLASPALQTRNQKDRQILHALNRLTFGPQPGDIERVEKMGLRNWIEQQLNPERMSQNPELAVKLQPLETLAMVPGEIVERYPNRPLVQQIVNGRRPLPSDPFLRAVVENMVFRSETRKAAKAETTSAVSADSSQEAAPPEPLERLRRYLDENRIQTLRQGSRADKEAILAALPPDQVDSILIAMPPALRKKLMPAAPPSMRRRMMLLDAPQRAVTYDLWEGKTYRAIYSDRQLAEVLDDFWFNHFNVFLDKGQDLYMVPQYEREAIRPHVLGKFRDLLEATAKSPAMLFFLDNWESVGPHSRAAERANGKTKKRGLNESYARELMELHTLGVNGGYSQKDVIEVARCFSGWTIQQPRLGGEFAFNPNMHDTGAKFVLGHKIQAGGMEDGEEVLDILARHPATAKHISFQLAQRFVSDNPPEALINRMARTFLEKDGDLREVMKTMLDSPEFWSDAQYLAKIKTPFEMAVSAVRALDADVDDAFALTNRIASLGQPLYRKQEPTGYSSVAADWMNSAALLARLNFSLALARNQVPGIHVDTTRLSENPARMLLMREPSAQTVDAMREALDAQKPKTAEEGRQYFAGLVIGSPDFQRH